MFARECRGTWNCSSNVTCFEYAGGQLKMDPTACRRLWAAAGDLHM